jgi:hypothetical protein
MIRTVLIASAAMLAAAPAAAATYSARLASPAAGHIVARDINWACAGAACQGATEESRPPVLCQALVKQAGKVETFAVDGRVFSDAELGKCNASAKPEPNKALAAQ